jgi:SAM-dependent methyltransferase
VAAGGTEGPVPTTGIGVDTCAADLQRGRELAATRSLSGHVTFVEQDAATWREPADRVLCVGASHTLGGTVPTLKALAELVRPGGRVLFGDACWERPPTPEAAAIFGEDALPIADLVEQMRSLGWRVLHLSTADQREWDDFESTWRAGRQEWLLAHPDDPRAREVREKLDAQLSEYVGVYRGILGLGYFVLGR